MSSGGVGEGEWCELLVLERAGRELRVQARHGQLRRLLEPAGYSGLGDGDHTFRSARPTRPVTPSRRRPRSGGRSTRSRRTRRSTPSGAADEPDRRDLLLLERAGREFECKLDTGSFPACTSPKSYSSLADGDHTFQVRATDAAGNTGPAASFSWTVDTVAPDTTIDSQPSA